MSYLDIARSTDRREREARNSSAPVNASHPPQYEINERNEKIPGEASSCALLTLQDEIVAAVSATQSTFDRRAFDRLWVEWHALQAEESI